MEGLPNPVLLSLRMTFLERIKLETNHLSSKQKFLVHGLLLGTTITLLGAAQSISAQWSTAGGTNPRMPLQNREEDHKFQGPSQSVTARRASITCTPATTQARRDASSGSIR